MATKNKRSLEDTNPIYEEDWSDKLEPYASSIGLVGDAIGIGAGLTGIGIPAGSAIAMGANIPNVIIDGYQFIRDGIRSYKDYGKSLPNVLNDLMELGLDGIGIKFLSNINKAKKAGIIPKNTITLGQRKAATTYKRVGSGANRTRLRHQYEKNIKHNTEIDKALNNATNNLTKRGIRQNQGSYFENKLIEEMAKQGYGVSVNDVIKSANKTYRQNLIGASGISSVPNLYHIINK